MAPPIKPMFAVVPTKAYAPSKPLFASEAIESIHLDQSEIAAINPNLTLTPAQLKEVQSRISQMNMKSTRFDFIDDIGMSSQMTLTMLSDWTARTAMSKLFADTRLTMIRIQQITSHGVNAGLGGRLFRLLSRIEESPAVPDISLEIDYLRKTSPQRSDLSVEIKKMRSTASNVMDRLATDVATCRGLLIKGKPYAGMVNHAENREKSLQLSFVICKQLVAQLDNLLEEINRTETDIKTLSLNLIPAWDVNRSLKQ